MVIGPVDKRYGTLLLGCLLKNKVASSYLLIILIDIWTDLRVFDVAPLTILNDLIGEEDLLLADCVGSGAILINLDKELFSLDPTDLLRVKCEDLVPCSLDVGDALAARYVPLEVLDLGRAGHQESVVALLVLEDVVYAVW